MRVFAGLVVLMVSFGAVHGPAGLLLTGIGSTICCLIGFAQAIGTSRVTLDGRAHPDDHRTVRAWVLLFCFAMLATMAGAVAI